jgi:hypothetical protein
VLLSLCVYVSHQLLTLNAAEFDACQAYPCPVFDVEATCVDNINGPANDGPDGRSCQCPSGSDYDGSRGCVTAGGYAVLALCCPVAWHCNARSPHTPILLWVQGLHMRCGIQYAPSSGQDAIANPPISLGWWRTHPCQTASLSVGLLVNLQAELTNWLTSEDKVAARQAPQLAYP